MSPFWRLSIHRNEVERKSMTTHRWVDTPPIGRWCEGCTLTEAEVTGDECGGRRTVAPLTGPPVKQCRHERDGQVRCRRQIRHASGYCYLHR